MTGMTGDASGWLVLLCDLSLKSALLLGAAWALALAMRRASAAARHLLWLLTFAALLLLPPLSVTQPPRPVPVLPAPADRPLAPHAGGTREAVKEAPSGSPRIWGRGAIRRGRANTRFAPAGQSGSPGIGGGGRISARLPALPAWPRWVCLLWLAGALLAAFPLGIGWIAAARRIRRCAPVTDPVTLALAGEAGRLVGVRRPVSLRSGPGVTVPVTLGLLRPVVLLPDGAASWPAARLRVALLHELAHVRRGDWAVQTLARLACALFWHNPLVWIGVRRLRAEAERACDDRVLALGVPAPDYAHHLLAVAAALAGAALPLAVPMAGQDALESRLRAVLTARSRRAPSRRLAALAFVLALAVLVPLATLRPAARAAPRTAPTLPLAPTLLPASPKAARPSPAPVKAAGVIPPAPVPMSVPAQPTPKGVPPMKPPMPVKAALTALAAGLALPAAYAKPTTPVKHAAHSAVALPHTRSQAAPPSATPGDVISLDDPGGSVLEAIAVLFREGHRNYVVEPGVSGSVSVHLNDVPFDKALNILVGASSQPLAWSIEDGVYHVRPRTISPDVLVSASGPGEPIHAPNPLVSLDLKKVPIRQALDSLFTAGKANYTVAAGVPDDNNTVTIHLTNVPLVQALGAVLAASATPLLYTVQEGGIFVITPKHTNGFGFGSPFGTRFAPTLTEDAVQKAISALIARRDAELGGLTGQPPKTPQNPDILTLNGLISQLRQKQKADVRGGERPVNPAPEKAP